MSSEVREPSYDELGAEARRLWAEVRRLRVALQLIADLKPDYNFEWGYQLQDIAERALEDDKWPPG
jgi:hypothetical protein